MWSWCLPVVEPFWVHTDDQVKETVVLYPKWQYKAGGTESVMDHFSSCAKFISTTKKKVMFLPVPGKPYQELTISSTAKANDTFSRLCLYSRKCSKSGKIYHSQCCLRLADFGLSPSSSSTSTWENSAYSVAGHDPWSGNYEVCWYPFRKLRHLHVEEPSSTRLAFSATSKRSHGHPQLMNNKQHCLCHTQKNGHI